MLHYAIAVLKPLRLAICLLAALAVLVSGCGSTKTTSTNASTSVPVDESAQTVPQSTSSKEAQHARKAREPKVAEAKPERKEKAAETKLERKEKAAKAKRESEAKRSKRNAGGANPTLEAAERQLPLGRRYPKDLQRKFMVRCEAAKGSTSSCECVVAKLETSTVEEGQVIAELLAVEFAFHEGASLEDAMRHRVRLPRPVARIAQACRNTSK